MKVIVVVEKGLKILKICIQRNEYVLARGLEMNCLSVLFSFVNAKITSELADKGWTEAAEEAANKAKRFSLVDDKRFSLVVVDEPADVEVVGALNLLMDDDLKTLASVTTSTGSSSAPVYIESYK